MLTDVVRHSKIVYGEGFYLPCFFGGVGRYTTLDAIVVDAVTSTNFDALPPTSTHFHIGSHLKPQQTYLY